MAHLAIFTVVKRIQINQALAHPEKHFNFNREKTVDKNIMNMKLQLAHLKLHFIKYILVFKSQSP